MPVLGVPLLECICWDHDRFGKDYMGEFDIALEDIFQDGQITQEVGMESIVCEERLANANGTAQMVQSQIETTFQSLQP